MRLCHRDACKQSLYQRLIDAVHVTLVENEKRTNVTLIAIEL